MIVFKRMALITVLLLVLASTFFASAEGLSSLDILDLYDNTTLSSQPGLKADWGFSCLIRGTEKTILFDTGQKSSILLSNMKKLGIDPRQIDLVVLSHIHPDHIGGLSGLLQKNRNLTLYVPKAFRENEAFTKIVKRYSPRVIAISGPQQICKDVYSTGEMNAKIYSSLINDEGVLVEQSLIIQTAKGLVVITGCGHPGIIEILRKATDVVKGDLLFAMGGFHLLEQNGDYVNETVNEFGELGVRYVGATHCTGDPTMKLVRDKYQHNYIVFGVGKTVTLVDLK